MVEDVVEVIYVDVLDLRPDFAEGEPIVAVEPTSGELVGNDDT